MGQGSLGMSGKRHWELEDADFDEDDDDEGLTEIPVAPELADELYEEYLARQNGD